MYLDGALVHTTPPPNFDLETNLGSLDRLGRYDATSLVYTHYGARGDEEEDVRDALDEYRSVLTDWVEKVEETYERLGDTEEVAAEMFDEAEFPSRWDEDAVREMIRMDVRGAAMYLNS